MLSKSTITVLRKYRGMKPEEIAEREGIEVREISGLEHFDDAIVGKTIFISGNLLTVQKRWRIAHCLGHYFMKHDGNQFWFVTNSCSFRPKQEAQADTFAACLITGMDADFPWTREDIRAVKAGRVRR